jgi:hypothetical protein
MAARTMTTETNASPAPATRIPLWLKLTYTAFMAVLIPVYWYHYGAANFLYFCDIALLLTLAGIWMESALLISMCCVGILLPQALWCADFAVELCGGKLTGMTSYMFDETRPLFLRGLSLFHGWLPFLLVYLVRRTGYAPKALPWWTAAAWAACLWAFFFIPGPANVPGDASARNVNYVFGMSDTEAQTHMAPALYLIVWMAALAAVVYWPTHLMLRKFVRTAA